MKKEGIPVGGMKGRNKKTVLEKEKEIETGIEELKDGKVEEWKEGWHTLDGQPLNGEPTEPGIYIKSGKKIVVGM